jgi:hypothetical protein
MSLELGVNRPVSYSDLPNVVFFVGLTLNACGLGEVDDQIVASSGDLDASGAEFNRRLIKGIGGFLGQVLIVHFDIYSWLGKTIRVSNT